MPKARRGTIKKPVTKRQLARWQRQKRLNRISQAVAVAALVLVLGIIGFGYYNTKFKPFHRPALKVNESVFDMGYYAKTLSLTLKGQDPATWDMIADQTVSYIQNTALALQGASQLGIRVDSQKVGAELKTRKWPDDRVHRDVLESGLLLDKIRQEYFKPSIPVEAEQVHVRGLLLNSKSGAEEAISRVNSGGEISALAPELSQDYLSNDKGGGMGWLVKGIKSGEFDAVAFALEPGTIAGPVYDPAELTSGGFWVIKSVEKNEEQVHVKGILLREKEEAEGVVAKLKEGQDFDVLARDLSQDLDSRDQGGDLGWLAKGVKSKDFEDLAFSLEPNSWGGPVYDAISSLKGGYWVLEVVEKDPQRAVDADTLEVLTSKAFNRWFSELREKGTFKNYLDAEKKTWAIAQALAG